MALYALDAVAISPLVLSAIILLNAFSPNWNTLPFVNVSSVEPFLATPNDDNNDSDDSDDNNDCDDNNDSDDSDNNDSTRIKDQPYVNVNFLAILVLLFYSNI